MIRIGAISLLVANTIGAGLFALPYLLQTSGWGTYLIYLGGLGVLLVVIHGYYGQALDRAHGEHRLMGLVKLYLPKRVFGLAAISALGGLLLTVVAYIILGATFLTILFPGLSFELGMAIMWALGSVPLFMKLNRFVGLEFVGSIAMGLLILFLFVATKDVGSVFAAPAFNTGHVFLPFGPILFALAGWTALGSMREYEKQLSVSKRPKFGSIAWATALVVALYFIFAVAIAGSTTTVTPDTLSGLGNWSPVLLGALALLGLVAIWTSYAPIVEEARDTFLHDFHWSDTTATMVVVLLPIIFIMLGLTNFLTVVSFAGGVFLSLQYVFIIFVAKHALRLRPLPRFVLNSGALLFSLAAVYEVYRFVVG